MITNKYNIGDKVTFTDIKWKRQSESEIFEGTMEEHAIGVIQTIRELGRSISYGILNYRDNSISEQWEESIKKVAN